MNKKSLIITGLLALSALVSQAKNAMSPDGRYGLQCGRDINLIDSSGNEVLTLIKNTTGDSKVEVQWSTDSKRVAVVETSGRASDIVAAFQGGGVWHKTIEMDNEDQSDLINLAQHKFGRLVSEHRTLGSWVSEDAIRVNGEMTFTGGKKCRFNYTLEFGHGPVHLSRAGYEDGAVIGTNFNLGS